MSGPAVTDSIDWHLLLTVLNWLGLILMGILTWAAKTLWNDVQMIKGQWLTRPEFDAKMEEVHKEREAKHLQNVGNFGEIHDKVNELHTRVLEGQVAIERRLGEVMTKIAELRPSRPGGQPERRHGY